MATLLSVGASVLVSDIDVVYVRNPFQYLHRDSDVEGTTDGWNPATAYVRAAAPLDGPPHPCWWIPRIPWASAFAFL